MIEAYMIALLSLSLLGTARDAIDEKKMLNTFETPMVEALVPDHPSSKQGRFAANIAIDLRYSRREWSLYGDHWWSVRYIRTGDWGRGDEDGFPIFHDTLVRNRHLKNREENESLQEYTKRVEGQRQELLELVKPKIEANIKAGPKEDGSDPFWYGIALEGLGWKDPCARRK